MSYNKAEIKGNTCVGGISGNNEGVIENTYNTGNIIATNGYVGGIVGKNTYKLSNSYSTGNITSENSTAYIGGVIGYKEDTTSNIAKCYYLENTANTAIGGISDSDLKNQVEVRSGDFMKTKYCVQDLGIENWKTVSGYYPFLYWQPGDDSTGEFCEITTAQGLKDMEYIVNDLGENFEGKTVRLLNNINLDTICSESLGSWEPIGNNEIGRYFSGTFDGLGSTINNLYINNNESEKEYQALFGVVKGGTIQNVTVSNASINSNSNYTSAVVGSIENIIIKGDIKKGIVKKCQVLGGSISGAEYVGGIVADVKNSSLVDQCKNTSLISGTTRVGGIVANVQDNNSIIQNSCNEGGINGTADYIGGIVSDNFGKVYNCYNTAIITGSNKVGGIVGCENSAAIIQGSYNVGKINGTSYYGSISGAQSQDSSCLNNYYLENTSTCAYTNAEDEVQNKYLGGHVEIRSDEFMKSKYFIRDLQGEDTIIWNFVEEKNNGYPTLIWQEGEEIEPEFITVSTPQALKDMAYIVDELGETFTGKIVTLQNNINLSSICSEELGNWDPIGNETTKFSGTFDGNNKRIEGLYINTFNNNQGLFGVNTGDIKNLSISGNVTTSGNNFGNIVGKLDGGNISNCRNYCIMNYNGTYNGGIVGYASFSSLIQNCINYGEIDISESGTSNYIGGILGGSEGIGIEIIECGNEANINGGYIIGGILGSSNSGNIYRCYNKGRISGTSGNSESASIVRRNYWKFFK